MMFTYIKHDIKGFYVELETELTSDLYSNLGTTWEDFISNKWVKLSGEQVAFRNSNPKAKIHEVWNMQLDPVHIRDINDAKREKKIELDNYSHQYLSNFKYNDVNVWIEPAKRLAMKNEALVAKNNGNTQYRVQDDLTLPIDNAIALFDNMSIREFECSVIVNNKKAEIDALKDIDLVDAVVVSDKFPDEQEINDIILNNRIKETIANNASLQVLSLISMTINTMDLNDTEAYKIKNLYPQWETLIGQELSSGTKFQYDGKLFKVIQSHTSQENWKPGIETASLYVEINESHAGTKEDPIPYSGNMILEQGKFYTQHGVVYECIEGTYIAVFDPLVSLSRYVKASI